MYTDIVSFDCANRTLAYTYARVNMHFGKQLRDYADTITKYTMGDLRTYNDQQLRRIAELIVEVMHLCDNFIRIKSCGILDVIGANINATDEVFRTRCLNDTLSSLNIEFTSDTIVLIENQPNCMQSNVIQAQLMMYFCDSSRNCNIILVEPELKNKINLDDSIHMDVYMQHCRDKYQANKMHSAANFLHLVKTFGFTHMLKHIDTKYDDLADSCMQMYAYLMRL